MSNRSVTSVLADCLSIVQTGLHHYCLKGAYRIVALEVLSSHQLRNALIDGTDVTRATSAHHADLLVWSVLV